jgi:dynein heavy chain
LETSIKITNEPPTGMQANLHKALDNFDQGGFQLEFESISRVINHMTCYKFECSHWWKIYFYKKNILQDFLSSLNAVISTNERH